MRASVFDTNLQISCLTFCFLFLRYEDAAKALEASHDKKFFGTKVQVTPHEGLGEHRRIGNFRIFLLGCYSISEMPNFSSFHFSRNSNLLRFLNS